VQAGSPDAQTVFDTELRAVQSALDEAVVEVEKLMFFPIEWSAGMRAAVEIDVDSLLLTNREQGACAVAGERKLPTLAGRKFIVAAEWVQM